MEMHHWLPSRRKASSQVTLPRMLNKIHNTCEEQSDLSPEGTSPVGAGSKEMTWWEGVQGEGMASPFCGS